MYALREDAFVDKGMGGQCGKGWVGIRGNCRRSTVKKSGKGGLRNQSAKARSVTSQMAGQSRDEFLIKSAARQMGREEAARKAKNRAKKSATTSTAKPPVTRSRLTQLREKFGALSQELKNNMSGGGKNEFIVEGAVSRQADYERMKRSESYKNTKTPGFLAIPSKPSVGGRSGTTAKKALMPRSIQPREKQKAATKLRKAFDEIEKSPLEKKYIEIKLGPKLSDRKMREALGVDQETLLQTSFKVNKKLGLEWNPDDPSNNLSYKQRLKIRMTQASQ